MIRERFPLSQRDCLFLPRAQWVPFPPASDRGAWEALPAATRQALLEAGTARLGFAWPFLPAVDAMAFMRDGNRLRYETPYFERRAALIDLVLAACVAGDGRFLDDVVNGIWATCEESSWSLPAHYDRKPGYNGLPDPRAPELDLFAAETGALLALASYLLAPQLDGVSLLVNPRVRDEIARRVLVPARERDDFGWMGLATDCGHLNNWTPWIVSNWMACLLLQEENPANRSRDLDKALGCLDRFLKPYPADGGCDEGPGYWCRAAASLFDALEWLHSASAGAMNLFDEPLVREMGRFIVRTQIADLWFVNFADAGPRVSPSASVVYGYGARIGDAEMQALGAWLAQRHAVGGAARGESINRMLQELFTFAAARTAEPAAPPLPRDAWLPVIEVMTARDTAGSPAGWFVAAKGGHNAESHNHNDVGAFLVSRDGAPLLVDAGVGEYTRQTFSAARYTIWTMQSAWHNLLPTCDGVMQAPGRAHAAQAVRWQADDTAAELSLEIQAAWPPEAGLARWQRTVRLERGRGVIIRDAFALNRPLQEITLSLLTPSLPVLEGPGAARFEPRALPGGLHSAAGVVRLDGVPLTLEVQEVPVADTRLGPVWGECLYRLLIRLPHPPGSGNLVVQVGAR